MGFSVVKKKKTMNYNSCDTSGSSISGHCSSESPFVPWQPSTWPDFSNYDEEFHEIISRIFKETIIDEISNVIKDAQKNNGSLEHRGHVIAIAQLCAIDTLSSYAFFDAEKEVCKICGMSDSKIKKYETFIKEFFSESYRRFAHEMYKSHRNEMIHGWNLLEVGISPGEEPIEKKGETLYFGILNFQKNLEIAVDGFLKKLKTSSQLQQNVLNRYKEQKKKSEAVE